MVSSLKCDIIRVDDVTMRRQKVAVMEFYEKISQGCGRFRDGFQGNLWAQLKEREREGEKNECFFATIDKR